MIDFEHTIFVLLLLTGVLNAKPPQTALGNDDHSGWDPIGIPTARSKN